MLSKFKNELSSNIAEALIVSFLLAYSVLLCIYKTSFDSCSMYFSKYYKVFEQVAAVYHFKSVNMFTSFLNVFNKSKFFISMLMRNCKKSIRNFFLHNTCVTVFDAFVETTYSELGCRAFSMEMAHRNCAELIREKLLVFNKARQSVITTDILEIITGALHT